jgi:hypothetical protein
MVAPSLQVSTELTMHKQLSNPRLLKALGSVLFALILASNLVSMSHWTEERGVNDDFCYLRQAHLFQRFGLGGFDTSLAKDDDGYVATRLSSLPGYAGAKIPPCHTFLPASNKYVIQYPPGTGLLLALFPSGHQVVPLFALSTILIFVFANMALWSARSQAAIASSIMFGCLAIYMMINPTKASYSMAPTMVACAIIGLLTALFLADRNRQRIALAAVLGLSLGIAVNFRLANLFLAAGYAVYFLVCFLQQRDRGSLLRGLAFGLMFAVGLSPTLASNAINAGSMLSTTYSSGDAVSPDIDFEVVKSYLTDLQFVLIVIAVGWTALIWRRGGRDIGLLVGTNLLANVLFFATHPVFTPYYAIPIAALSLWTLVFATAISRTKCLQTVAPAAPS